MELRKLLAPVFAILLLLVSNAEAASLRKRYVNTASSAGGNGTTSSTSGGNRAYATLYDALVAEADDLVADDVYLEIEATGSAADTSCPDVDGFTTDATRYVHIYPAAADEHLGVWSTGKYRVECSADNAFLIRDPNVRVTGIQLRNTQNNPSRGFTLASGANGPVYLERNIIRGPTSPGADSNGIRSYTTNDGVRLRMASNLIYGFTDGIYLVTGDGGDMQWYVYNNTIADNAQYGIFLSAYGTTDVAKLRNNLIQSSGTADYLRDGGFDTLTTSRNVTEDATSPDGGTYQSKTATFTNGYHLDAADTAALTLGTDLSADGDYAFSFDIDNETRSGAWDIGADQTVSGSTYSASHTSLTGGLQDLGGL